MLEWLVLADDRTGALEVAGSLAVAAGPVPVVVHGGTAPPASPVLVVDLASRHLSASVVASRASDWSVPARRRLHKIDSTLRGRWADELVAVQRATRCRVLVVPALPRLGRTCCGGVVHVDGRPLTLDDPRHGPVEARPSVVLEDAGAGPVVLLAGAVEVMGWLLDPAAPGFAVCDATADADLAAIAEAWAAADDVVLAGTSAALAAAVDVVVSRNDGVIDGQGTTSPGGGVPGSLSVGFLSGVDRDGSGRALTRSSGGGRLPSPVLVVVGSLHPVARGQVAALDDAGVDVEVLVTAVVDGPVADADAERVAAELAATARRRLAGGNVATLVLVGGDTAAAVLGDGVLVAGGTVAPGIPWSRRADGSGPLVVTKAGGFGDPRALVDLVTGGEGR
ncbi:MAG: four-carbon acid sugar kinase family protein [Ilumatobacteraceae bacterium]